MKTTTPKKASVLLLVAALLIGVSASATTIYNNTLNDLNSRFSTTLTGSTTEFGDEIIFAGTQRQLTNFSFEYWAFSGPGNEVNPANLSPTASARIRFYLNNGPLTPTGFSTPGWMFYDSGAFLLSLNGGPTTRATFNFSAATGDFAVTGLSMPVLSNMTWTVQFTGLDANDSAGLDVFYPPTVGTSPAQQNNHLDDYWEFSAGSWALKTNISGINMSFAAKFDAVPEPSTIAFGILGGLGLFAAGRRVMKRKE